MPKIGTRERTPSVLPVQPDIRLSRKERKKFRALERDLLRTPPAPPAAPKPPASELGKRRWPWVVVLVAALVAGGLAFQFTGNHPGTLQHKGTVNVGKPAPAQKPVTDYQLKMGQLQGTWPSGQHKAAAVTNPANQVQPNTEPQTQTRPQTDTGRQTTTQTQVGQPPAAPAPPTTTQNQPPPSGTQNPPQQQPSQQPSPDQASGSNSGGSVSNTDPQDPNQGQNGTCPPGESPDGSGGCW